MPERAVSAAKETLLLPRSCTSEATASLFRFCGKDSGWMLHQAGFSVVSTSIFAGTRTKCWLTTNCYVPFTGYLKKPRPLERPRLAARALTRLKVNAYGG